MHFNLVSCDIVCRPRDVASIVGIVIAGIVLLIFYVIIELRKEEP